jgi:hypothetical protein
MEVLPRKLPRGNQENHEKTATSSVAAQLATSQEGLNSMKFFFPISL